MAESNIQHKITTLDIAWAAGFLEGEGWFSEGEYPRVGAGQKQREPLERLQRIFGGKITFRGSPWKNGIHWWVLDSRRSIQVMMTLFCLMSPRRQSQIKDTLGRWRRGRLLKAPNSNICALGHPIEGENIVMVGKYARCKTCRNTVRRAYRSHIKDGTAHKKRNERRAYALLEAREATKG